MDVVLRNVMFVLSAFMTLLFGDEQWRFPPTFKYTQERAHRVGGITFGLVVVAWLLDKAIGFCSKR